MGKSKRGKGVTVYFLVFIIVLAASLYLSINSIWYKRMKYPLQYEEHIKKYSAAYSLDPHIVAAVIWVESKYRADAVSSRNAMGLMQVLPSTAGWGAEKMGLPGFEDDELLDPETNINIGCWYLNYLAKQFPDNVQLVLASYNGGIGNVKKWLKDEAYSEDGKTLHTIPFRETREYVSQVTESYEIYKKIYPSLSYNTRKKGSADE